MTLARLASRTPGFGAFDTVIHGIAQQVHERIADLLHHRLVQFGFRTADDQVDVLAQLLADVAYHSAEAVERIPDRDHAQVQGTVENVLHQT